MSRPNNNNDDYDDTADDGDYDDDDDDDDKDGDGAAVAYPGEQIRSCMAPSSLAIYFDPPLNSV